MPLLRIIYEDQSVNVVSENIRFYPYIHNKPIHTLCGLISEFLDVQASGIAYAENTVFQRVNFLQGLVLYDLFFWCKLTHWERREE